MTTAAPPFKKILIANRGEIACRIIKTAKRMGIATVAVYSDADQNARHVKMADEAVYIGGSPAAESYLRIDALIEAARQTGAQAVHPGFGFVSENSAFAEGLEKAGICFIGPPVQAMASMGDKLRSKEIAAAAGVNTIPGDGRIMPNAERALIAAKAIGFPVMLKASAGGGGKGMRIARNDAEVIEGFESASNEARKSFGDDRMLVEKFIENPRHIEIQIMADKHGNTLYLGERECSIQRRHQKVIEEAPSPFVTPAVRKAMGEQSVALAQAVGYVSAGTVEFVVDPNRNFYFLEMNTRLQVEHPVTEFITGLDIVELMIRVAANEPLALKQEDVKLTGWAMEARIYAEDPDKNFMPSTGRLQTYRPPVESSYLRNDTGVEEGSEISMFYDPMIAKLIAGGESRDVARKRLSTALDSFCIRGIRDNISFLNALATHPKFAAGDMSTGFIDEHFLDGFNSAEVNLADNNILPVVAGVLQHVLDERNGRVPQPTREYVARSAKEELPLTVNLAGQGYQVSAGGKDYAVTTDWQLHDYVFHASINNEDFAVQVDRKQLSWRVANGGRVADIRVLTARAAELIHLIPEKQPPDLSKFLLSPMPGLLVRLQVSEGDEVKAGQELAVVEAMKMENSLRATQDAVISVLRAAAGDLLVAGQSILEFE
ncbi:MAG: acetyl/propionyl/methylcrotonyl-CoA carboxylase subunit alpha [Proteobacteria bacterium]|nr:acetyl/propionyl/methylcrotonyl-CoA carboxylase subunit alpha [Pseudomonadota bacterium]